MIHCLLFFMIIPKICCNIKKYWRFLIAIEIRAEVLNTGTLLIYFYLQVLFRSGCGRSSVGSDVLKYSHLYIIKNFIGHSTHLSLADRLGWPVVSFGGGMPVWSSIVSTVSTPHYFLHHRPFPTSFFQTFIEVLIFFMLVIPNIYIYFFCICCSAFLVQITSNYDTCTLNIIKPIFSRTVASS